MVCLVDDVCRYRLDVFLFADDGADKARPGGFSFDLGFQKAFVIGTVGAGELNVVAGRLTADN